MNVMAMLLLLLALAGEKMTTASAVAGRYVLEGAQERASELQLLPNGQFEYAMTYGAADYKATGKWRTAGGTVVLDSRMPDGPAFRLVRSYDLRSPDVRVWVRATGGRAVANLEVALTTGTGEQTVRTDRDGMALFVGVSDPRSVVIRVPVYNKDSGTVKLNPAQDDFTFELNSEAITTVPFRKEALRVQGETLEMGYWDRGRPLVYRRK